MDSIDAFKKENNLDTLAKLKKIQDKYRVYSTGSLGLDAAIGQIDPIDGNGGIPEGTICEVFGRTGSGKNIILEHTILDIQRKHKEGICFILFAEQPILSRMESIGIDLSRVISIETYHENKNQQAELAEKHLETLCRAAQLPDVKLCAVDSIKSLVSSKQAYDKKGKDLKEFDQSEVAIRAVLVNKFIEIWMACTKKLIDIPILMNLNQVSDSIGPKFIVGEELRVNTPGGRFKEDMAKLRISLNSSSLKNDEHPLFGTQNTKGLNLHYKIIKNKLPGNSTGLRSVTSEFLFEEFKEAGHTRRGRFFIEKEILAYAVYLGLIPLSGRSHYDIQGTKLNGKEKAQDFLRANPLISDGYIKEIIKQSNQLFEVKEKEQDLDDE